MDYRYIEQLLQRYFNAETSLEEESILRTFFSQKEIPAEMQQWRALFVAEEKEMLDDDFDARILAMIEAEQQENAERQPVKARRVTLTQQLKPLFKAAAVVAIILTLGGALQAPWDSTWTQPSDYAHSQQVADTVAAVQPIQAENMGDRTTDSTQVLMQSLPKD